MFACIYIPDFPVETIVRVEPLLRERAMAVLEGNPPLVRVIALNDKARHLGMEIGMTKLQAAVFAEIPSVETRLRKERPSSPARRNRQVNFASPQLAGSAVLRPRSLEQESSAHAALLDVAHAFTPRVEDTAPDTLLLDLAGMERLYGEPAKMARNLASQFAAISMEANIALAANPDTAVHAARGFNGITVIPSGQEAQRLGMLPLHVLSDSFEISQPKKTAHHAPECEWEKLRQQLFDTLERWGIRDFRALALLPEPALASRLGETGVRLQRLARGVERRTLALCEPASRFEEAIELECSVETIEPLSFVLNRLLERLCARLEARALAVQELRLRLQLERRVADEETVTLQELTSISHNVASAAIYERTLRLPVSMCDPKVFLKLLQLDLAAHPPGAPVTKLWVTAERAPPRSAQRGLFLPITPEVEKLEITLARISGIVGERRAGIAHLLDTHRRDGFQLNHFVIPKERLQQSTTLSENDDLPPPALRIFRPARRLLVRLSEGSLVSLTEEIATCGELQGQIVWASGPWRSSGDWWTENAKGSDSSQGQLGPWDREEWDVALVPPSRNGVIEVSGNIALYRIYRDLATEHWFADAIYD